MEFYSCSESAPDLASKDECSLTSAIFEMEKLTKLCLKKKKKKTCVYNWLTCMFFTKKSPNFVLVWSWHRVELSLTT